MLITKSMLDQKGNNQSKKSEFCPSDRATVVECPVQDPLTWGSRNSPLPNNII